MSVLHGGAGTWRVVIQGPETTTLLEWDVCLLDVDERTLQEQSHFDL